MNMFRINLVLLSGMLTLISLYAIHQSVHAYLCNGGAVTVPMELTGLAAVCTGGIVYCAKRLSGWNGDESS